MKTIDIKSIALVVLVIALIVVSSLLIKERNKPDTFQAFSQELSVKQANVKTACADVTSDEKRSVCLTALQEVQVLLAEFSK